MIVHVGVLWSYISAAALTNTLDFIDVMIEQFPFPVQRIQCDRGCEFFAVCCAPGILGH
jgi:hypothetical protein